jgi:hypothetical protein
MSIEIKFKEEISRLTFEQVPNHSLFIDEYGRLMQKTAHGGANRIAVSDGTLLSSDEIPFRSDEKIKKIYDIEKIEFS